MLTALELVFFIIFSVFAFWQVLAYGIYEFKEQKNKVGGIFIILFGLLASVLSVTALVMNQ